MRAAAVWVALGWPLAAKAWADAMSKVHLVVVAGGRRRQCVRGGVWRLGRLARVVPLAPGCFPYVQLGAGVELTRARIAGHEDRAAAPMAFVGVGSTVDITDRISVGANVRTNVMRHYLHMHQQDAALAAEPAHAGDGLAHEYELAAQAQFFAQFVL